MPTIPDVLVGLTGVSAAGFVGKKVLSGPAGISDVKPAAGYVGDLVTIATAGIIQSGDDLPGVTVSFGAAQATRGTLTAKTTTSLGVLIEAPIPASAAGSVDVTVSVPNAPPSTWTAGFNVYPRIAPGQNLAAQPGGTLTVTTSGVTGLGPELPNLRVTIGDTQAGPGQRRRPASHRPGRRANGHYHARPRNARRLGQGIDHHPPQTHGAKRRPAAPKARSSRESMPRMRMFRASCASGGTPGPAPRKPSATNPFERMTRCRWVSSCLRWSP